MLPKTTRCSHKHIKYEHSWLHWKLASKKKNKNSAQRILNARKKDRIATIYASFAIHEHFRSLSGVLRPAHAADDGTGGKIKKRIRVKFVIFIHREWINSFTFSWNTRRKFHVLLYSPFIHCHRWCGDDLLEAYILHSEGFNTAMNRTSIQHSL